jgi:lipopolysaccharide transport system permease protein
MQKTIIDSSKKKISLEIDELIRYKDLFYLLALRDFKVRYAQTFLGFLWAFIQPLITISILFLIFGKGLKVNTNSIPYPLFVLSGMIAWSYFSFVLSNAGSSIIASQSMVQKIYFPRIIIPLSKVLLGLVDFLIVFVIFFIFYIYYGYKPSLNIVFFPLFIFLTIITGLTFGIWLSALTIRYRDFQAITPFAVQIGLYISPVAYPSSVIPEKYYFLYYLNPMAGIIDWLRWSVLNASQPSLYSFLSFILVIILFVSSLYYFKKMEKIMSDII